MEPAVFIVLYLIGVGICVIVAFLLNESCEHEEYCMQIEKKMMSKNRS